MKVADKKCLLVSDFNVQSPARTVCTLVKYEHVSRARERVNRIRPTPFQHATGVRVRGNLHPWPSRPM